MTELKEIPREFSTAKHVKKNIHKTIALVLMKMACRRKWIKNLLKTTYVWSIS